MALALLWEFSAGGRTCKRRESQLLQVRLRVLLLRRRREQACTCDASPFLARCRGPGRRRRSRAQRLPGRRGRCRCRCSRCSGRVRSLGRLALQGCERRRMAHRSLLRILLLILGMLPLLPAAEATACEMLLLLLLGDIKVRGAADSCRVRHSARTCSSAGTLREKALLLEDSVFLRLQTEELGGILGRRGDRMHWENGCIQNLMIPQTSKRLPANEETSKYELYAS